MFRKVPGTEQKFSKTFTTITILIVTNIIIIILFYYDKVFKKHHCHFHDKSAQPSLTV